jgi:hypothetical protein
VPAEKNGHNAKGDDIPPTILVLAGSPNDKYAKKGAKRSFLLLSKESGWILLSPRNHGFRKPLDNPPGFHIIALISFFSILIIRFSRREM